MISDHAEYILDGLQEYGAIDGGSGAAIRMWADGAIIDQIVAHVEQTTPGAQVEREPQLVQHIYDYATELIDDRPQDTRTGLAAVSLQSAAFHIRDAAKCMAAWAIGDHVEGGYCQPHWSGPVPSNRTYWDEVTPTKKSLRRLTSPAWIRRYVRADSETRRLRHLGDMVNRRCVGVPLIGFELGLRAFEDEWDAAMDRRRDAEVRQWADFNATRAGLEASGDIERFDFEAILTLKPEVRRAAAKGKRTYRRRVKRAAQTAVSVLGSPTVADFTKGLPVLIRGDGMALEVHSRGAAGALGHGGLRIEAQAVDGTHLADLCLYFDDTPALDQLVAIHLHMQSGLQKELIDTANLTRISQAGLTHPALEHRDKRAVNAVIDMVDVECQPWQARRLVPIRERRLARDGAYVAATLPIWVDSLAVATLGRTSKVVKQLYLKEGQGWAVTPMSPA